MTLINATITVENSPSPATGEKAALVIGYTTAGPSKSLTRVATVAGLTAAFGLGAAVEEAALLVDAEKPVYVWRADDAVKAYGAAPVATGAGTSVATYDAAAKPNDRCHATVLFVTGGTIGTAGATYKLARCINPTAADYGPELQLGTANFIETPDGIRFNFAAGTVVAGQTVSGEGILPKVNAAGIAAAIAALAGVTETVDMIVIASEVTATEIDQIKTSLASLLVAAKKAPQVFAPLPAAIRTEVDPVAWQAAHVAIVAGKDCYQVAVGGSEAPLVSVASGRTRMLRNVIASVINKAATMRLGAGLQSVAAPLASPDVTLDQEAADTAGPTIQSLTPSPTNTNTPYNWNERISGANDANRICELNFVPGFSGTFIASAPVLSAPNTSIVDVTDAMVTNAALEQLHRAIFTHLGRTYETVAGGRFAPYAASNVEDGISGYVKAFLGIVPGAKDAAPAASDFAFTLDRADSIADRRIAGFFRLVLLGTLAEVTGKVVVTK